MSQYAYHNLMRLENNLNDYYENTVAVIAGSNSDVTNSALRYTLNETIITISSATTSTLNSLYPHFCASVADNSAMADVILNIMNKANWNSTIFLYSNTQEGADAFSIFKAIQKITIFPQLVDNNFADVIEFVNNQPIEIVIMFCTLEDILSYFKYLNDSKPTWKKLYISGNNWVYNISLWNEIQIYKPP